MTKYQDSLRTHLAQYKASQLRISEPGTFSFRGRAVQHHHILPVDQGMMNVLEEASQATADFFGQNPGKRHKDFHHLNSSQAFTFNLFFPYFSGGSASSSSLLRALGQEGQLENWEVEAIPDIEEQSNIDALWTTSDGVKTFCEVKLSEAKFGTAAPDSRHLEKLAIIYRPVLEKHLGRNRIESAEFFKNYQCYRNLWHMVKAEQNRLIFLLPRANAALWPQLKQFFETLMIPTRARVSAVAIEDVLTRLQSDDLCPVELRNYADKLARKYLVGNAQTAQT